MREYSRIITGGQVFPEPPVDDGRLLLDTDGEGEYDSTRPGARTRGQVGRLKASQGNKDKLLAMIDLEKIDYRDLLCHADKTSEDGIRTMN